MSFITSVIALLLQWYVWGPLVIVLLYLTWRNYRSIDVIKNVESVLLTLEIPKTNDKSELAAEQMFEIASVGGRIQFYVWTPKSLQSFVEGQIYAQYPQVQIHKAEEDYVAHERHHSVVYTSEVTLTDKEFLPIKTFQSFEVDPLAGITGTLAKLEDTDEEIWIQMLVRPVADSWHKEADAWIQSVKAGGFNLFGTDGIGKWIAGLFSALWQPPEQAGASGPELSERDKTRISEAEKKATKLGYQVKVRVAYLGERTSYAKLRMQGIIGTFKQFNSTNLNGFKM